MDEIEEVKAALVQHKQQIDLLAAETMALQFIVSGVLSEVIKALPQAETVILSAFDAAANAAERLSIEHGKQSGHMPKTLEIVEQLRRSVKGKDKPRHGV
ncbi:hypothetical protein [Bradyrhizobium sp. AUGA SZCCT0160]|uniref:hypothetical protein n=1 Tax=Bradyrhizobium sp. AUGA SZCCT0160 TaxID=2807662 RepID=UPI001BA6867D|nr:hypothetical protein [Bradyrhizobium sp. AUGA SZCCT0160]MBR1193224.1 hypothetical protein [Bradyrhizobium sp. AUGA SZCCT0160]